MTDVNRTKEQVADMFNALVLKTIVQQSTSGFTIQVGNAAPIVFKRPAAVTVRSSVSVSR